jgi:hypothetical protein
VTRAQLLALLLPLVRQLVKGGLGVTSFAAEGDDVNPTAWLTITTPAGPRAVGVPSTKIGQAPGVGLLALQTAIVTALRPWQTANRNGFDRSGSTIRGLPGQEIVYGQPVAASDG